MSDNKPSSRERRHKIAQNFSHEIGKKEALRIRGLRQKAHTVWFGLGMFGLVGWSVAIPTLIGVAIGIWIDSSWPSRYSWTLMMLIFGVGLGCINAWYWVRKAGIIKSSEDSEFGGRP